MSRKWLSTYIFFSKSIGNVIAGELTKIFANKHIKNLFITPTQSALSYIINNKCTVIVGTNDRSFPKELVSYINQNPNVDLHLINKATHSLEVDDSIEKSLEILNTVTKICERFVSKKDEKKQFKI